MKSRPLKVLVCGAAGQCSFPGVPVGALEGELAREFAGWVDAEPGWERLAPVPVQFSG